MKKKINKSDVEKKTHAIVEVVRKWRHYLGRGHFSLLSDKKKLHSCFMVCIKVTLNVRIMRERLEPTDYSFVIQYRRGKQNIK